MNSFEILQAMTDIPGEQILVCKKRLGYDAAAPLPRRHTARRTIALIAAIGLMALLVGCAVVYMLSLQDMKVGEYSFNVPTVYDDEGNVIPPETRAPITRLSLQGANMEALAEWVAYTEIDYQDLLAPEHEYDATIPENYRTTYGCYSQEMVDKLEELVAKYDLKLLSERVFCEYYESEVLLGALGFEGVITGVDVEYGSGYFYKEGSFDLSITLPMDTSDGQTGTVSTSYHYSLKEYFDPVTGSIRETGDYTQWNYTRKDGQTVLLVLGDNIARIYTDLPDAFVSIHVDPYILVGSETTAMTKEALEQLAELFNFSIQPQAADMAKAEQLRAEAQAKQDAKFDARIADFESACTAGYDEFVRYRLETSIMPEIMLYILYDVNGDGVEELVIDSREILSMKDGQSYLYFSLAQTDIAIPYFQPCKNEVFEVYSEITSSHYYYFYQAVAENATFLTGVIHDTNEDIWYLALDDNGNRERITAEKAQEIRDSYTRVDFDWLPLKKYGMDVASIHYKDPYAKYLASKLERYDNAVNYEYTLLDLNGDGIEELISRDVEVRTNEENHLLLSIHSIKDGELWDMGAKYDSFTYICEGGVLEYTEEFSHDNIIREHHSFYRCTENGIEFIEKISRSPTTGYWSRTRNGQELEYITKEEAQSVLAAYQRLELNMKPLSEYPFK